MWDVVRVMYVKLASQRDDTKKQGNIRRDNGKEFFKTNK